MEPMMIDQSIGMHPKGDSIGVEVEDTTAFKL